MATSGNENWPPEMKRSLPALFTSSSIANVMNGAKSRSITGRNPAAAAPAAVPAMIPSASGVLRTRRFPNSLTSSNCFVATPSPNVITRGSRRISSASAVAITWSGVVVVVVMVLFMVISSSVDVSSELIERGIRRREREGSSLLDAFRCARANERQLFARDAAVRLQPRFEQRDRIARFPERQLGRIDVRLIVRLHVAAPTIDVRLPEVRL